MAEMRLVSISHHVKQNKTILRQSYACLCFNICHKLCIIAWIHDAMRLDVLFPLLFILFLACVCGTAIGVLHPKMPQSFFAASIIYIDLSSVGTLQWNPYTCTTVTCHKHSDFERSTSSARAYASKNLRLSNGRQWHHHTTTINNITCCIPMYVQMNRSRRYHQSRLGWPDMRHINKNKKGIFSV